MKAYYGTLETFYNDISNKVIENKIIQQTGMNYGASQIKAFRQSLPELKSALQKTVLSKDAEVAIGFMIPLATKRIDFLMAV